MQPNQWVNAGNQYEAVIPTTLITQDILDSGIIFLYYEFEPGSWIALPTFYMLYIIKLNEIQINSANNYTTTQKFRLVTVEGSLPPKINFNDYEEVMHTLNIVEQY